MAAPSAGHPHLCCPFCDAYEVDRLFVATHRVDACECRVCGAGWEEELLIRSRRIVAPASR
jgi:hypothetical protein